MHASASLLFLENVHKALGFAYRHRGNGHSVVTNYKHVDHYDKSSKLCRLFDNVLNGISSIASFVRSNDVTDHIILEYTLKDIGTHVHLEILKVSPSDPSVDTIVREVNHCIRTLSILDGTSRKEVNIILAMFPDRKVLPKVQGSTLGSLHVNSGLTYTNLEVCVIYRREEWRKVLLHELLHLYHFDFHVTGFESRDALLASAYNIVAYKGLHIHEAYNEALTTFLYYGKEALTKKTFADIHAFKEQYMKYLIHAKKYMVLNVAKILHHYGYSSFSELERRRGWIENTHVFSYYVAKAAIVYHTLEFMAWCRNECLLSNNTKRIHELYDMITAWLSRTPFRNSVNSQIKNCNKHNKIKISTKRTLRMVSNIKLT